LKYDIPVEWILTWGISMRIYPEILSSEWLIKNKHLKKAVIEVNLLK
jgi:hypothetical protein